MYVILNCLVCQAVLIKFKASRCFHQPTAAAYLLTPKKHSSSSNLITFVKFIEAARFTTTRIKQMSKHIMSKHIMVKHIMVKHIMVKFIVNIVFCYEGRHRSSVRFMYVLCVCMLCMYVMLPHVMYVTNLN